MSRGCSYFALTLFAALPASAQEAPRPAQAAAAQPPALHRLTPQTAADLQQLLRYAPERLPLVSAHRGGARPGLPENCLATFEATLRHTFALLEVDPRYTKDGAIVLHHDPTLDRTTTGAGPLADKTLAELRNLRLKDPAGQATDFGIPTLDESLEWARGKAVLVLDQKDVPVAARVRAVEARRAEAYTILIVYRFADAQACYALNPRIVMEVMIPSRDKLAEFDRLGVPWNNVVAFVGHTPPDDPELYAEIHRRGACCLVGTSRNLDRELVGLPPSEQPRLLPAYRALFDRGADLLETDVPSQLAPLLFRQTPIPVSRRQYFQRD